MSYKFDGKYLKHRGSTIGNVSGDRIRKGSGSTTVANISGDRIRKGSGSTTLCNVRGRDVREGSGSSKIATMDEIDKIIDGPGGVTKVALWYVFIK